MLDNLQVGVGNVIRNYARQHGGGTTFCLEEPNGSGAQEVIHKYRNLLTTF